MTSTRITTILGTRPELIRLACIIDRLDQVFEHRLIHTGQNSDPSLSRVFLDEMKIRDPDAYLEISVGTLGSFLGDLFNAIEIEFNNYPPDAIVILGDTNSALAGIIAKRRGIPVYHLEAGNRSFDQNVPEEINRHIVDHFSDFNMSYTSRARENLIREGLHPRSLSVIGSPLNEVLLRFKSQIDKSPILKDLELNSGRYFLVSAHRQENVDDPHRLTKLISALNAIAVKFEYPIIVSTHPRTKNKLELLNLQTNPLLNFHEPFGFFDYNKLQSHARIVFSDSGSVSEESVILGFPAITIRDSMERPEALESGSIIMSGITELGILEAIEILESGAPSKFGPPEYLIQDSSTRVVNFIASTIHQHSFWNGLRKIEEC
jgi:UDP-N-acetylglucosamine 2-epimerase (non-hydrolysing)